ncbi:hypothetical protein PybrP1_008963 [[Pythium] brassicae (nom. inval.)]|nr:hypothetical protein PybrP1_008963 [[Pythium] brassicae (nom. inval.)]
MAFLCVGSARFETAVDALDDWARELSRRVLPRGGHASSSSSASASRVAVEIRHGESGVYLKNVTTVAVATVDAVHAAIQRGAANRSVSATATNEQSSRSHCVLTLSIERCSRESGETTAGRLVLVDLAGSERLTKTAAAAGPWLREAQHISKSLSAISDITSQSSQLQAMHEKLAAELELRKKYEKRLEEYRQEETRRRAREDELKKQHALTPLTNSAMLSPEQQIAARRDSIALKSARGLNGVENIAENILRSRSALALLPEEASATFNHHASTPVREKRRLSVYKANSLTPRDVSAPPASQLGKRTSASALEVKSILKKQRLEQAPEPTSSASARDAQESKQETDMVMKISEAQVVEALRRTSRTPGEPPGETTRAVARSMGVEETQLGRRMRQARRRMRFDALARARVVRHRATGNARAHCRGRQERDQAQEHEPREEIDPAAVAEVASDEGEGARIAASRAARHARALRRGREERAPAHEPRQDGEFAAPTQGADNQDTHPPPLAASALEESEALQAAAARIKAAEDMLQFVLGKFKEADDKLTKCVEERDACRAELALRTDSMDRATGATCMPPLTASECTKETVRVVWDLTNGDEDGSVDADRFALALHQHARAVAGSGRRAADRSSGLAAAAGQGQVDAVDTDSETDSDSDSGGFRVVASN